MHIQSPMFEQFRFQKFTCWRSFLRFSLSHIANYLSFYSEVFRKFIWYFSKVSQLIDLLVSFMLCFELKAKFKQNKSCCINIYLFIYNSKWGGGNLFGALIHWSTCLPRLLLRFPILFLRTFTFLATLILLIWILFIFEIKLAVALFLDNKFFFLSLWIETRSLSESKVSNFEDLFFV